MSTIRVTIAPAGIDSNKGDQALVAACIRLTRNILPDAEIGVISTSAEDCAGPNSEMRHTRRLGVTVLSAILASPRRGFLQRRGAVDSFSVKVMMGVNSICDLFLSSIILLVGPYRRIAALFMNKARRVCYDFINSSKCIFIKGGGFIFAYKGLRYWYYLYFQLYTIMLAHRLNVPVLMMPNSFGPFDSKYSRWLTRKVLSKCKVVGSREKISVQRLHEIGLRKGLVRHLPDMGFMVEPISTEKGRQFLLENGVNPGEKNVGITVRPWRFPNHGDPERAWSCYMDSMRRFVKYIISKGYRPVFFPQSIGPHDHEDDRIAIKQLCEGLEHGSYSFVDGDWLPGELAGMYGCMEFFVGTRMHSVIFSMTALVPVIAISYQGPKATGIMQDAKLNEFVIDISEVSFDKLSDLFDNLEENKKLVTEKIAKAVAGFKDSLKKWEQETAQLIN